VAGAEDAVEPIYVYLPDEAVDVWAPVGAEHVRDDVYRIVDCRGEDEEVQFRKGELVRCRLQRFYGGEHLTAYERAYLM
jgi:hypothetical protein